MAFFVIDFPRALLSGISSGFAVLLAEQLNLSFIYHFNKVGSPKWDSNWAYNQKFLDLILTRLKTKKIQTPYNRSINKNRE